MKLNYNVTGAKRKSLVGAVSKELNAPLNYLGAPTFAYEVGGYHIDKTGTVTGKDNLDLEDALRQTGFDTEEREYDEPDTADLLTVEFPLSGFTPEKLDNLVKLVTAKETLLKAALGVDTVPIQQTEDTLRFPWFVGNLDADHTEAYTVLISMLCKTAKEKKRVTSKERDIPDNPKYAMRCFLLSLGFIGNEYKYARKILLSRLDGNSSWKNGKKTEGAANDEG